MAQPSVVTTQPAEIADGRINHEAYASGVSWPAIIAGAFVTAALWLILLALGAGIGLSAVSPWARAGASAATVGILGIFWLIIVQVIASAMGGYLAGRLRTKWAAIHTDEVHFRDTAHGLLAWSVSLVITGAFLISAAGTLAGGMRPSGPGMALPASSDMAPGGQNLSPNAYFVDLLFRSDHPIEDAKEAGPRAEAARIFTYALGHKELASADQAYLAAMVAANTGLSAPASERRVAEVYAAAQQAADDARKAAAHLALWLFISFLIGAFCASYAATIGGRQRDQVVQLIIDRSSI
jgi:hypothetical protein